MRRAFVLACVVAVGLAGCLDGPDPTGPDATTDPTTKPSSGNETPTSGTLRFSDSMFWSGCTSFIGAFDWPGDATHARHPPGWDPMRSATTIQMLGWECERIHWSSFERGPVRMFLESHNYHDPPDSCRPDPNEIERSVNLEMLNSLWIDDADIAAYAQDVYGMPVHHAVFSVENGSVALGPTVVWNWGLPGGPQNEFEVLLQTEFSQEVVHDDRLYWFNETGVSFMDASFTRHSFNLEQPRYGHGVFHEPLLMAKWPTEYHDTVEYMGESHAGMEFQRFLDFECRQEIDDP